MILELDKVAFTNDMFTTVLPSGSTIILNSVDENFLINGSTETCVVKAINIEIVSPEGVITSCPCIIGLGNELMKINTAYTEYEGEVLTPDNRMYCTIEVYE